MKKDYITAIRAMVHVMNPSSNMLNDIPLHVVKKKRSPRKPSDKQKQPRQHLEKNLEVNVIKWLRIHGAVCGRIKTMGRQIRGRYVKDPYLFIGFPDVVCFHKNKLWFLEIKSSTGSLRPEQTAFLELCKLASVNHIVVKSLSDVDQIIK